LLCPPVAMDTKALGNDGERKGVAYYRSAVVMVSLGFLGTFSGFNAAQNLQTSLNATLGDINLACLYGTFTVLCLIAPPALASLERVIGLRMIMFGSVLAYVAMILSNLQVTVWALPISMNVLVGVAAPLLWTLQNDYVGRCAYHAAHEMAESPEALAEATSDMTAQFNAVFFTIYQFSGMIGTAGASVILLALSGDGGVKKVLFLVLAAAACMGGATFLFLPKVTSGGDAPTHPSVKDTAVLAVKDPRVTLLIPIMFANGMTLSFIFGDFAADITCPVAGPGFVGFVAACFYAVNGVSSTVWGKLLQKRVVSRRVAYILSVVLVLVFLLLNLVWTVPQNYVADKSETSGWRKVSSPDISTILVAFGLSALFATGDAFLESGPPGTLQNFFAGKPELVPAMANYKMWQSLGLGIQFVLGAVLKEHRAARIMILMGVLGLGLVSLLVLDLVVAPLDTRRSDETRREQAVSLSAA